MSVLAWLGLAASFAASFAAGLAAYHWSATARRTRTRGLSRRGRVLYQLAEGEQAHVAEELEAVFEAEPADVDVFLALAAIDRRLGRIDRAKSIHRTVLAISDLSAEHRVATLVGLGRDLLAEGREQAAVGALVRASSLAPRSAATLDTLARALERAGAWERAATAWERLEKLVDGPLASRARQGRGHAYAGQAIYAQADGEHEKASKLAERAVALAPDSGHAWATRARVESRGGDPSRAVEAWQRAWELAPAGAAILVEEAESWADRAGHLDAMLERMRASLSLSADPTVVLALVGRVGGRSQADRRAAKRAVKRVAERSGEARLALMTLRLRKFESRIKEAIPELDERVFDIVDNSRPVSDILCGSCGRSLGGFVFRCHHCDAWDSARVGSVVPAGGDESVTHDVAIA